MCCRLKMMGNFLRISEGLEKQMRYHETPYARLFLSFLVSYCSDSDGLQAKRNVRFSTHMNCGSFVAEQRGRSYGRLSWEWQNWLCT